MQVYYVFFDDATLSRREVRKEWIANAIRLAWKEPNVCWVCAQYK